MSELNDRDHLLRRLERERSARRQAESFQNQKSLELSLANQALARVRDMLEHRVSARTRELEEMNANLEQKSRYLEVVNSFALSLLQQSSLDEVLWDIARNAVARLGLEDCVIYLLDEPTGMLIQKAAHGPKNPRQEDILNPIVIPLGEGVVGTVAATGRPALVGDTRKGVSYIKDDAFRLSELAVPIINQGKVIGVIDSEDARPDFYTQDHLELFKTIAALASTRIAVALKENRLQQTVSDLETTKLELETARKKAVIASHHKSEFLANMSHEIRTPLNGVLGLNSLLQDTELDEEQQDYVQTIRESGETLLTIINDILDFSKIEAGKLELEVRRFDVHECVRRATTLMGGQADAKGLQLETQVGPGVPQFIKGDVTRVQQILVNLLSNAVKFTQHGVIRVDLTAEAERRGDRAVPGACVLKFAVTDSGIGIPEARRRRLFKPFQQVDASTTRKFGGTGLGLAICKRLTEMQGGNIWVDAAEGGGSVFCFTIEALADEAQAGRDTQGVSDVDTRMAERHPLRLLVAEDNIVNQKVTLGMLARLGYEADVANNGGEAFERIQAKRYDAVLMDVQMPVMDGVEAARQVRLGPADRQPYIIAFTADVLTGDEARFQDAGMNDYVHKPVQFELLVEALAACPPGEVRAEG